MITGSIVAIVTPMTSDLNIDWRNFKKLIEFHIENGTSGIVVIGTTGESATITTDTHIKCIEFAIFIEKLIDSFSQLYLSLSK